MIVLAGFVLGGVWGTLIARQRGGNRKDMAQYAAAYGILLGLIGLFVTIGLERVL